MNTRFSSLVTLKKSAMEKSERVVQNANKELQNATEALQSSYALLADIELPNAGNMSTMMASRDLMHRQRDTIIHNKQWVEYASTQLELAKEQLKKAMIEHEKFKYLELEEIKKILKKQKLEEAKELDEVALMTFTRKDI